MYDVVIIGAGASGCAAAMELAKYNLNVCVIEKDNDVCCGTSKANSAIVHAGFDAKAGSLKAKLNVEGNEMIQSLSKTLDFPYKKVGAFVVSDTQEGLATLEQLYENGKKNGVKEMELLAANQAKKLEPNLSEKVKGALWAKNSGIVCPFLMTIAFAEMAAVNGVKFFFDESVHKIEKLQDGFLLQTSKRMFSTKTVVNAAGVYADSFHNMVSSKKLHITPRRGEYILLDRSAGTLVNRTIFQVPGKMGKGVLVTPTVHGNLLVGPTAQNIDDKEGVNTTAEGLDYLKTKSLDSVKNIPFSEVITSFAGLRAQEDGQDFVIGEIEDAKGFVDVAGIASPGLSSAPAIGKMASQFIIERLQAEIKQQYETTRKGTVHFKDLSTEEQKKLILQSPAYGNVICRCEMVTEGEILDAIHRTLGATTLDGVKRRVRAGMGRCQSGFCMPKVMEILERECGYKDTEVKKSADGSEFVIGNNKEI